MEEGKKFAIDAYHKMEALSKEKLAKPLEALATLNKIPFSVFLLGLLVNLILLASWFDAGWAKGYALVKGEPFEVHASLGAVKFGPGGEYTTYVPGCEGKTSCSLSVLAGTCSSEPAQFPETFKPSETSEAIWCKLSGAGAAANGLMWLGFLPGLLATIVTGAYSARAVEKIDEYFHLAESKGFKEQYQKIGMCGCWAAYTLFLFIAMLVYASQIPDSLGVGPVVLEGSFGVIRLCFFLSASAGATLTANLFNLWNPANVGEAYLEFQETPWATAKKGLYFVLLAQAVLYLLLSVQVVAWEALLVFICFTYLDAKKENFMLLYLVCVGITILLDIIKLAYLPSFSDMSAVDSFGNVIFIIIFLLKFVTIGTIYLYVQEGDEWQGYASQEDPEDPDNTIAE